MVVPPENRALASAGTRIALVTSEHPKHPPESILDGNLKTFWISTGMFPQEFVVTFPAPVSITKIIVSSIKGLEDTDNVMQTYSATPQKDPVTARHVRFEISKGYAPFVSVHRLVVYGERTDPDAKHAAEAAES
eukprot:jgi/Hompol1/3911/HPOL_003406-RA